MDIKHRAKNEKILNGKHDFFSVVKTKQYVKKGI